jgi:hypothetical protein
MNKLSPAPTPLSLSSLSQPEPSPSQWFSLTHALRCIGPFNIYTSSTYSNVDTSLTFPFPSFLTLPFVRSFQVVTDVLLEDLPKMLSNLKSHRGFQALKQCPRSQGQGVTKCEYESSRLSLTNDLVRNTTRANTMAIFKYQTRRHYKKESPWLKIWIPLHNLQDICSISVVSGDWSYTRARVVFWDTPLPTFSSRGSRETHLSFRGGSEVTQPLCHLFSNLTGPEGPRGLHVLCFIQLWLWINKHFCRHLSDSIWMNSILFITACIRRIRYRR